MVALTDALTVALTDALTVVFSLDLQLETAHF